MIRHVLVPTDFSPTAEAAAEYAAKLAAQLGARLTLLSVFSPGIVSLPEAVYAPTAEELRAIADDVEARLRNVAARLARPGLTIDVASLDGEPAPAIVRAAIDRDADLIVMGTHGRRGVQRLILGSVAESVLRRQSARGRGRRDGGALMRLVDADTALACVRSGQQLFVQGGAATPTPLLDALVARAGALRDLSIVHMHTEGPAPHLDPSLAGRFRHKALFIGPNARQAVNEGRADYIPVFLSDVPSLFTRGKLPVDVALVNVAPPDAHGFCSLGLSVDVTLSALRAAKTVVAMINPRMPRTHGESFVHVRDIHYGVELAREPYAAPPPPIGDVERRIGARVAELVPDGATLQLGIGAIPAAVCAALGDKRDLGVHTEMFTDGVVDLVERGVITGAKKQRGRGKIVAAFILGSPRVYTFADDNPAIEMRGADYTNDPAVIKCFTDMCAINSAIEVDLSGQVCADSIGERLYSGVGGQVDFIRGAALAERGRAIIALPATAAHGTRSRIVATLTPGAGVVTTRAHVQTVVTEHGVAELHGKGIAERARALIGIAAPQFRDELMAHARKAHFA
jgi:4-hydroxybutyrate CoA-transferase